VVVEPTPSQTVGPFFSFGLCARSCNEVVAGGSVRIEGRVLDGADEGVPDAMVEIWHATPEGRYDGSFGWGRSDTDGDGRYWFVTVKPGAVDGQAPHLLVLVFARGLLRPVLTRMYFPDEGAANDADPVLAGVGEDATTLIAKADNNVLRFDVRLQDERQTAFFEL
jgi:protocatechuate 3,4-dioxygenase alpha subunit